MRMYESILAQMQQIIDRQDQDISSMQAQHSVLQAMLTALREIGQSCNIPLEIVELKDLVAGQMCTIDEDAFFATSEVDQLETIKRLVMLFGRRVHEVEKLQWTLPVAIACLPILCDLMSVPYEEVGCFVLLHACLCRHGDGLLKRQDCRRPLRTLLAQLENIADQAESGFLFPQQLSDVIAHLKAALR